MVGFLTLPMVFGVGRRHRHADGLPAGAAAVVRADHPVRRHPHRRTELRLRAGREGAAAGRRTGPVDAALRAQRCGADRRHRGPAFLAAGERFGLPPTAMVPAYGMAETTLGVSIQHTGSPFTVDVLDAAALEQERVARPPASPEPWRRQFPRLGPPLDDIEVQVRDDGGAVLDAGCVGTLFIRGPAVTDRYLTVDGDVATQGVRRLAGHRRRRATSSTARWWSAGGSRTSSSWAAATSTRPTSSGWRPRSTGCGPATPSRCGGRPPAGGSRSWWRASPGRPTTRRRWRGSCGQVRSAVTTAIGARPADVLVLPVGALPKTPSGKLKRSAARELLEKRAGR